MPASAATPVAPVAPVAVSVETLKRVEPMVARDEQAEPAEQPIAGAFGMFWEDLELLGVGLREIG